MAWTKAALIIAIGLTLDAFGPIRVVDAGPAAPGGPKLTASMDVSVVVEGSLPGFKAGELAAYVSEQMNAARAAAWRFSPAGAGAPANRIVWRFRLLPFAGGSVRYIGPVVSHAEALFGMRRPVGVDARIFIDGQFQSTTFDQASVKGGAGDADLAETIRRVTRSVLANAVAQRSLLRASFRTE